MKARFIWLLAVAPLMLGQGCPAPAPIDPGTGGTEIVSNPLVGNWASTNAYACGRIQFLEFKADNSAIFDNLYYCGGSTLVTYAITGQQLQVDTGTAFGTVLYTFSINGNQLTLASGSETQVYSRQ